MALLKRSEPTGSSTSISPKLSFLTRCSVSFTELIFPCLCLSLHYSCLYLLCFPDGSNTNFMIQLIQTDFVLCKLKEKRLDKARISACDEGQSSRSGPSDNRPIEIPISEVRQSLVSVISTTTININVCSGPMQLLVYHCFSRSTPCNFWNLYLPVLVVGQISTLSP